MDEGRHNAVPYVRLLPHLRTSTYPVGVADDGGSDVRRVRIDRDLWEAYAEVVGDGGRSTDIKAYVEWRVDNPTTPLPGRRRGPVKRVRKRSTPVDDA
jgi:hypothetical protein